MKLGILHTVLFFICTQIFAQSGNIQGKVIDGETKEPVPYVHIAVGETAYGTSSNGNGEFTINIRPYSEKLKLSHVSYEPLEVSISDLYNQNFTIELTPATLTLSGAVVEAGRAEKIIDSVFNKGISNIDRTFYGKAFYRQLTQNDNVYNELLESFYDVKLNVKGKAGEKISTGRYAKLAGSEANPYLSFTNFFYMLSMPAIQDEIKMVIFPINKDYRKYYEVDIWDFIERAEGGTIAIINFTPLLYGEPVFQGQVYIDTKTYDILRISGTIPHNMGLVFNKPSDRADFTVYSFDMNYEIHEGIAVLRSGRVECELNYIRDGVFARHVKVSGHFFVYELSNKKPKRVKFEDNTPEFSSLKDIINADYNPSFWEGNPIVKRTPVEESVIESFESSNAFGTMLNKENK